MRTLQALGVGFFLSALPLQAQVKVTVRPDGSKVMVSETRVQHARRVAARLVAVPDEDLRGAIDRHAYDAGLDPRLVQAVVQAESGYNRRALSNKGAMGLMQLMPETARDLAVTDPWDAEQNLSGGTAYLRQLLDRFDGSVELALASYNAGPAAVTRYGGVPPYAETVEYVRRIVGMVEGPDAAAGVAAARLGRRVFLQRDASNRILLTTEAPR